MAAEATRYMGHGAEADTNGSLALDEINYEECNRRNKSLIESEWEELIMNSTCFLDLKLDCTIFVRWYKQSIVHALRICIR